MKKKIVKRMCFWCGFLLIFNMIMRPVWNAVRNKARAADVVKNCYAASADSYDVLFVGPSVMYRGISPMEIWNGYGITSYDLCVPSASFCADYFMLKEMLEHHELKTVVLSVYSARYKNYYSRDHRERFHQAIDDIPFDLVRLEFITDFLPEVEDDLSDKAELAFPFLKYHSRWNELERKDFETQDDYLKGFAISYNCSPQKDYALTETTMEMTDQTEEYFQKIVELCAERNLSLILLRLPGIGASNDPDDAFRAMQNNCLDLGESQGLDVVDFEKLEDKIGFDLQTDMLDSVHVNTLGALKISDYMGNYLAEQLGLTDYRSESVAAEWNQDYKKYQQALAEKKANRDEGTETE